MRGARQLGLITKMEYRGAYFWAKVLLMVVLAIGWSRAFFLTVMMGGYFKEQASNNMMRSEKLEPIRGVINDAYGKPLAMNIDSNGQTVRYYPGGEIIASIVGYLGKPSEGELKNCKDCDGSSLLGKAGLEKEYEDVLRGESGELLIQETASGKGKTEVRRVPAKSGENIQTNIDFDLQKESFLSLKRALQSTGKSGALIVAKVSGEVLAFASVPSYDPNLFVPGGKRSDFGGEYKDVSSLIKDTEKKPLFVRPLSGDFAPGSVYKLVPALAALETGKINKDTQIEDTGEIKVGEYRFGNWFLDEYGRVEGLVDVEKAISRSNDIFFYKVGEMLGADNLILWTKKFGFGDYTNIDLPGESNGFVPTPYWREKTLGEKWFLGNTYHMSIGQGDLMVTPLQINRMTAAVISGLRCEPRVVGVGNCIDLGITEKNRNIIKEGMLGACNKGGTAYPLFDYGGKIYCKTGTAQKGGKDTKPNAWISVVVPKGGSVRDWLVMTILIEEGGQGSAIAAPIAKEILPVMLGN